MNYSTLDGCCDGIKRVAPAFVFDVALPSLDVYSDCSLILGWYLNGHLVFTMFMAIPVLLQFAFTSYKWVRLENREDKRWSWIVLLLQFWPQWRALRIIKLDLNKHETFQTKKKEFMREVTTTEPFLEAWPSIIIMTIIWLSTVTIEESFGDHCKYNPDYKECRGHDNNASFYTTPDYCIDHPEKSTCAVFGGFGGRTWFFTTYAISVITGSLGITKFLQTGPFSVLNENGPLGGLLRWKFILAYNAVMLAIVTKGVFIAFLLNHSIVSCLLRYFATDTSEHLTLEELEALISSRASKFQLILLVLSTIPNLLFSLVSIACSTGLNKKYSQVIFRYPAAWMLPVVTYFVIGPIQSVRCSRKNTQKYHLGLSKHCSFINMILTVIMYGVIIAFIVILNGDISFDMNFYIFFLPVLGLGLVFNIIFLLLDQSCFFSKSQNCFCTCCCGPECYENNTSVINAYRNELEIMKLDYNC